MSTPSVEWSPAATEWINGQVVGDVISGHGNPATVVPAANPDGEITQWSYLNGPWTQIE